MRRMIMHFISFLGCTGIGSLFYFSDVFGLGTAGDMLTYHNGLKFSTKDQDNDESIVNCAAQEALLGAWWYGDCKRSSLNGVYPNGTFNGTLRWDGIPNIKRAEMKFRPIDF